MSEHEGTSTTMLTSYQSDFVDRLTRSSESGRLHTLVGPVGFGKSFATAEAMARLTTTASDRHILMLVTLETVERWRRTLINRGLSVTYMDPRAYRLLREQTGAKGALPAGVYLTTYSLALKQGVWKHLQNTAWKLIVLDARNAKDQVRATSLARTTDTSISTILVIARQITAAVWELAKDATVTDWSSEIRYPPSDEKFNRQIIRYTRSSEELDALRQVTRIAQRLPKMIADQLLNAASSSVHALESSLLRNLKNEVLSANEKDDIAFLIDAIAQLQSDAQLQTTLHLVRELYRTDEATRIVVFATHRETAEYVAFAIDDLGMTTHLVHGATASRASEEAIEAFKVTGGVMVCTIAEGVALPFVTAVIHYDLAKTAEGWAQREGKYRRFGREVACTEYFLFDASEALPNGYMPIEGGEANAGRRKSDWNDDWEPK